MEQRGVPTVVVGTDEFEALARLEASNRGLASLPVAVVRHPLGGIEEPAVQRKAVGLVAAVVRGLTVPAGPHREVTAPETGVAAPRGAR